MLNHITCLLSLLLGLVSAKVEYCFEVTTKTALPSRDDGEFGLADGIYPKYTEFLKCEPESDDLEILLKDIKGVRFTQPFVINEDIQNLKFKSFKYIQFVNLTHIGAPALSLLSVAGFRRFYFVDSPRLHTLKIPYLFHSDTISVDNTGVIVFQMYHPSTVRELTLSNNPELATISVEKEIVEELDSFIIVGRMELLCDCGIVNLLNSLNEYSPRDISPRSFSCRLEHDRFTLDLDNLDVQLLDDIYKSLKCLETEYSVGPSVTAKSTTIILVTSSLVILSSFLV